MLHPPQLGQKPRHLHELSEVADRMKRAPTGRCDIELLEVTVGVASVARGWRERAASEVFDATDVFAIHSAAAIPLSCRGCALSSALKTESR